MFHRCWLCKLCGWQEVNWRLLCLSWQHSCFLILKETECGIEVECGVRIWALAKGTCEIAWLQSLLKEIFCSPTSIPIAWCDNLSANALAANLVFHTRTKQVEVDVHFIRDNVLKQQLDVRFVPSEDQIADCLTKALTYRRFQFLRDKLRVVDKPPPLSSL